MCGIVGYVGNKTAQNVLLSGLKRLEYRGYDSAGIATLDDEKTPHIARSVGKISELEQVLSAKPHEGHLGIGHTRWATHGGVTVANAHPHHVGNIYLVHNGIIENYKELKKNSAPIPSLPIPTPRSLLHSLIAITKKALRSRMPLQSL